MFNLNYRLLRHDQGKVNEEHVVRIGKLEQELVSIIASFSRRDANNQILYNLGAIERAIGLQYFRFKPHISIKVWKTCEIVLLVSYSNDDGLGNETEV